MMLDLKYQIIQTFIQVEVTYLHYSHTALFGQRLWHFQIHFFLDYRCISLFLNSQFYSIEHILYVYPYANTTLLINLALW